MLPDEALRQLGMEINKREEDLTDEQVENWRKLLITLPLPPTDRALGAYALIMPRYQVVAVWQKFISMLNLDRELRTIERRKTPWIGSCELPKEETNLIRTRPRKCKNMAVRRSR